MLGNKRRRGSQTRFSVVGPKLYRAVDPDGTSIFFCERARFGIFLHPDGVTGRLGRVETKYAWGAIAIESADVVVDIGANVGEFTRAVAARAGRVIAIDPDPNVQSALAQNLSGIPNATRVQMALSDADGEADFYLSTKGADSSLFRPDTFSEIIKVRACTLDTLIREQRIDKVDFLKIEAEGWEPEILAGAKHTLGITRKVAVDAGPERAGAPTAEAVAKALTDAGFSVIFNGYIVLAARSEQES